MTTIASGDGDENFHNFENQVEFGRLAKLGGKFYESCWVRAIFFKAFWKNLFCFLESKLE